MKKDLSVETICAVFCKHNQVNPIHLYSTTRERPIAETRRMIWGYLRENTEMTWKELGDIFARDHATAMYNASKHKMHISVSTKGGRYDVGYSDKYIAAVIELDGDYFDEHIAAARKVTEDTEKKQIKIRSYMLTYYCPSNDRYIAPVVKATSLREAIQEYESYIPITDEELVIVKAL